MIKPLLLLLSLLPLNQDLPTAQREVWRKRLHWPQNYEASFRTTNPEPEHAGVWLHSLGGSQYLVQIQTFSGAYQPGQIFYIYDSKNGKSRLLSFDWLSLDEKGKPVREHDQEMIGLASFTPGQGQLELFSKSRGPGDCGYLIRWRFRKSQPILYEERARDCNVFIIEDNSVLDPTRWPRIAP
ncbi:MAG: DUF1176 domain-containing protein [Candidatus Sericytochromatia bacterium]